MPANHPDYVTGAELNRWLQSWTQEESNFRSRLEQRMAEQHALVRSELSEIKGMVKEANGKTNKNTEAIAVISRELQAMESEASHIDRLVEEIKDHGCAQFAAHNQIAESLGWSGRKKAAAAGGLVGLGALIWPALSEIAQAIHALIERLPR